MTLHIPPHVIIFCALLASYAHGLFVADFIREAPTKIKIVHSGFNGLVLMVIAILLARLVKRSGT